MTTESFNSIRNRIPRFFLFSGSAILAHDRMTGAWRRGTCFYSFGWKCHYPCRFCPMGENLLARPTSKKNNHPDISLLQLFSGEKDKRLWLASSRGRSWMQQNSGQSTYSINCLQKTRKHLTDRSLPFEVSFVFQASAFKILFALEVILYNILQL